MSVRFLPCDQDICTRKGNSNHGWLARDVRCHSGDSVGKVTLSVNIERTHFELVVSTTSKAKNFVLENERLLQKCEGRAGCIVKVELVGFQL